MTRRSQTHEHHLLLARFNDGYTEKFLPSARLEIPIYWYVTLEGCNLCPQTLHAVGALYL